MKYITTYKNHDPFLAPCLPSNPWQTDNDSYWTLNMRRWSLSAWKPHLVQNLEIPSHRNSLWKHNVTWLWMSLKCVKLVTLYHLSRVDLPTKMRVERWSFSLFELLNDLRGRDDFKIFLKKEFSGRLCHQDQESLLMSKTHWFWGKSKAICVINLEI